MAKAIISLGYSEYVLDIKDALAVAEMLGKAEKHERKYHSSTSSSTHHIYESEDTELGTLKLITDGFYRMAKMAGKPDKS